MLYLYQDMNLFVLMVKKLLHSHQIDVIFNLVEKNIGTRIHSGHCMLREIFPSGSE